VFNAGVASFCGIDWIPCLGQLLRNPMAAVTAPVYYLQRTGETSADNLGWVWQSNVFGHFALVYLFPSFDRLNLIASKPVP
jgi:3-keto steroid reductase